MVQDPQDISAIIHSLNQLKVEHRCLDQEIANLELNPHVLNNEVLIHKLKKRKLTLKDRIAHLESLLVPDIIA